MNRPITHLLYLHGFRSSPKSTKAQQMAAWVARHHPELHWWCPQLPPAPAEAAELIDRGTRDWPTETMGIVGSSLGGFYATWLQQRRGCRAVLINPAAHPEVSLARHLGVQTSWHDPASRFEFTQQHIIQLQALQTGTLGWPERLLCFMAKGDEVLDWREMHARHGQGPHVLIEGGDHAFSGFEAHLPRVAEFFNLPA